MKIAILMSTYNGEKYLEDQIKSLKSQTWKKWDLYVRDDGSSDHTLKIIKNLAQKDKRIHFISDSEEHLRPMKSFIKLLGEVSADYYFFCDQDDYWLPNKLELMLAEIESKNNTIPQLVYCGLKCVDKNLKPIVNDFENLLGKVNGKSRFIGNDMPGCVMLFNKKLRDLAIKYTTSYENIVMHDWWIALVAQTFGDITFFDKKLILYRQHGDNSIGAGINGGIIKKTFHKDVLKKQMNLVKITYQQSEKFYLTFNRILPSDYKRFLKDYIKCGTSGVIYRRKFLKGYRLHGSSWLRYQVYRFLFVYRLNKILSEN